MTLPKLDIPGYEIHGPLGRGGMAVVWLATQKSLERKVAIKVLLNPDEAGIGTRFIKEARFLASISHPRVLTVYNIAKLADGKPYIVMEFLSGGDLKQRMADGVEPVDALRIVRDIAEGLAVVHEKGIVHRDIKPANILFRDNGVAVLTDFGIARPLTQDSDLTQAGMSVGSPAYSSPEQTQCKLLDQRSDIYSLGVILLELLLKANPFRAESPTETAINHIQKPLPELPANLRKFRPLLNRMLAKEPDKRFNDCYELLAALDDLLSQIGSKPATANTDQTVVARASAAVLNARPPHGAWKWLLPVIIVASVSGVWLWTSTGNDQKDMVPTATVLPTQAAGQPSTATPATPAEPADIEPAPAPAAVIADPFADLFALAQQRLSEGKLTSPDEDNAIWYFEQVLQHDPQHERALAGMIGVRDQRTARYLELAEQRMRERRLMVPAEDNAVFYLQRALALAPGNRQAQQGLQRVTQEYVTLAQTAIEQRELEKALQYVNRGLLLSPGHQELLKLEKEIEQQSRPRLQRFMDRFR